MNNLQTRFEKSDRGCLGGKLRNRYDPRSPTSRSDAPGDFLARLWTLFGPPNEVGDEGFSYHLVDRQTGLMLEAYSGASGPAYAGRPEDAERLLPVLDELDRLLDGTSLSDCVVEYETERGWYRVGAANGRAFEEPVEIGDEQFKAALAAADRVLTQTGGDFWDYCNGVMELTVLWERLGDAAKPIHADPYRRTAHRLWLRALDAVERFAGQAVEHPESVRASDVETIAEIGLAQLKEVGKKGIAKFEDYSQRFRYVNARLRSLRNR